MTNSKCFFDTACNLLLLVWLTIAVRANDTPLSHSSASLTFEKRNNGAHDSNDETSPITIPRRVSSTTKKTCALLGAERLAPYKILRNGDYFREVSYMSHTTQSVLNQDPIVWVGSDGRWTSISAVSLATGDIIRTYRLDIPSGVKGADWESISLGPCSSDANDPETCLYIGDIGNNSAGDCLSRPCDRGRDFVIIYKLKEPQLDVPYNDEALQVATLEVNYKHKDMPVDRNNCEALFVDWTAGSGRGDIYMVTKHGSDGIANTRIVKLAVGDHENLTGGSVTSHSVVPVGTPSLWKSGWSGADMSLDGGLILLRSGSYVYFFERDEGESVAQVLEGSPCSFEHETDRSGNNDKQFEAVTMMGPKKFLEASECRDSGMCDVAVYAYELVFEESPPVTAPPVSPAPSTSNEEWVDITVDDFESGWGSFESNGKDSFWCSYDSSNSDCRNDKYKDYAHSGVAAVRIQDTGMKSSFSHMNTHDVTSCHELRIQFSFCAYEIEENEEFYVDYYDGVQWGIVGTWVSGGAGSNDGFYHYFRTEQCYKESVSLRPPEFVFPSNAMIRFGAGASRNNDAIYIDDVVFSCRKKESQTTKAE
eukprot:CAMPEP_0172488444 /NCGR_PEP_ID=MMETSP1066-20121228/17953_1 /TAXON_ID=671091 /ORGANISM="Coscinodiscus wailesii, Strain CCMP2513" /LENGTH=592 /DNA_ID=CAMNT_0013255651 /DNA_START=72 /DNA_END=1850 /DNA_ORIENTATION=+